MKLAAEPVESEPMDFEGEIGIEKLRKYISAGISHIPAEKFQAQGEIIRFDVDKHIDSA
jgi:hypothetical protein